MDDWLVVWNMFYFPYMGCQPSQLTNSLHHFSRWWKCTTNQVNESKVAIFPNPPFVDSQQTSEFRGIIQGPSAGGPKAHWAQLKTRRLPSKMVEKEPCITILNHLSSFIHYFSGILIFYFFVVYTSMNRWVNAKNDCCRGSSQSSHPELGRSDQQHFCGYTCKMGYETRHVP